MKKCFPKIFSLLGKFDIANPIIGKMHQNPISKTQWGCSPTLCIPSFKNLEGVLTILCALTQKRIVLNSIVLFWVSAQSIVKAPSKFLKLRFSEQVTSLFVYFLRFSRMTMRIAKIWLVMKKMTKSLDFWVKFRKF